MTREVPSSYYSRNQLAYYQAPYPQLVVRILQDIAEFNADPLEGVFISPQEDNVTTINVLMVGSVGTPYEGGFFQFLLCCPPDYPLSPPRVRLVTTDAGRVHFNFPLDKSGNVDLSIIGTASRPCWTPSHGLASVLVSLQSLMVDRPYFYGLERDKEPGDSDRYDELVRHETLRVAVCGQVEGALRNDPQCPPSFRKRILDSFLKLYNKYVDIAKSMMHLSGTVMKDVYSPHPVGTFQFNALLERLEALKTEVLNMNIEAAKDAAKKAVQHAAEQAASNAAGSAAAHVASFENPDRLIPVYKQPPRRPLLKDS